MGVKFYPFTLSLSKGERPPTVIPAKAGIHLLPSPLMREG